MSDPGLLKFELVTEEPAVLVANTVYFVKNATVNRIVISGNLPQDPLRVTSTTALENIASKMYIASGNTKEEARNSIDAAAIDHTHPEASGTVPGFLSTALYTKLMGLSNYVHPTSDGNLHVPATGTTNNGKVLKAGATAGSMSWGTLTKNDVGLNNVNNTTDAAKPVSTATQNALNQKSNLASPIFTGTPSAPTALVGTNTTQLATTAYVNAEIANDAAPIAHVGDTGAAHGVVTTSVAGFMSAADKTKLDGIAAGAQVNTVSSVAGKTGAVTLVKADVGLSSVDNTADASKPVSTAQAAAISSVAADAAADATTKANAAQAAAISASTPSSHVGSTGTAHGVATTADHGFMSSTDKAKLDGIAAGATANTGTVTGVTATLPIVSSGDTAPVISINAATTSAAGSMSAADKTKLDAISGTNTGDETAATIKSKLGVTTLSGTNTGDQTTITGNAGSATKLETARTIGGVSFDGSANIDLPGVNIAGNQNTSGTAERANGLNKTLVINGTNFSGVNDVNVSVGFLNIPLVSASANTLITKTHAGGGLKHPASDTTALTFTIDSNANQNWEDGTTIAIWNVNGTGGVVTIAIDTDTMRLADDGTTGSRSLRRNGFAILVWDIESLSWIISGPGVS